VIAVSDRFDLDLSIREGDKVFDYNGAKLVIDDVSYEFVRGATVDFADELIKSTFEVRAHNTGRRMSSACMRSALDSMQASASTLHAHRCALYA
jgi:Fe-S cluster assembly iron-binding protein IscA